MTKKIERKLFGTDGVRGHANAFPMTVENALALGKAAGKIFRSRGKGKPRVVIGKDTRLSCYMFECALVAGFCSMGVDTLMVGPLPTPGVAFITRAYRANAGVVISASHNSYSDNGIKFFSPEGFKLSDEMEIEIERLVTENNFAESYPPDDGIGRNTKIDDAAGRYIELAKASFPRNLSLQGMKVVIDCANGAAYHVAPLVFKELDADVFIYGDKPNGLNINAGCGSLLPQTAQKGVIDHEADVGIILDGDADRVIMIDENAQIVNGDTIMAICAMDMKKRGMLKNNKVIATVMSNFGVVKGLESEGIEVIRAPVGDRYVIQEMHKREAILGGEQSGHIIFLEHNTTGDGIVSALQVLRIMIESDSKLSDLAAKVKHYPQSLLNVRVKQKIPIEKIPELKEALEKIENKLGNTGRVLVRYSGTENLCRIMVESMRQRQAVDMAQELCDIIKKAIGE